MATQTKRRTAPASMPTTPDLDSTETTAAETAETTNDGGEAATTQTRNRRTEEQMIADLEAKLAAVRARAASKNDALIRPLTLARNNIQRVMDAATEAGETAVIEQLQSVFDVLDSLVSARLPQG